MNRYPVWKYVIILIALAFGALYTLPNFYNSSPALQINSAKSTIKIDSGMLSRAEDALKAAGIAQTGIFYEVNGTQATVKARFVDPDTQFKAKEALEKSLNPDPADPSYSVTFNSMSNTPAWLQSMHALPMFLGLDLRGGVHFLMQVDTNGVLNKRLQILEERAEIRRDAEGGAGTLRDVPGAGVQDGRPTAESSVREWLRGVAGKFLLNPNAVQTINTGAVRKYERELAAAESKDVGAATSEPSGSSTHSSRAGGRGVPKLPDEPMPPAVAAAVAGAVAALLLQRRP